MKKCYYSFNVSFRGEKLPKKKKREISERSENNNNNKK